MVGQILSNVFLIFLQPIFHCIHQSMGLSIDIVYAKIQTTTILTQNVYPNVFVGGFGFPIELCDKKKVYTYSPFFQWLCFIFCS
jgi:hypothetical protein